MPNPGRKEKNGPDNEPAEPIWTPETVKAVAAAVAGLATAITTIGLAIGPFLNHLQ